MACHMPKCSHPFLRYWICCSLWQDCYQLLQSNCCHLELLPGQFREGQADEGEELMSRTDGGLGEGSR